MNPLVELESLTTALRGNEQLIEHAAHIPSSETPEPYKQLLVHDHHMTVTMESFYGTSVDVEILQQSSAGNSYLRQIVLKKSGTDQVVQFGIVRFNFEYVTERVRDEILAGQIPLGRVLINHNVLRHIDLGAILKITAGPTLARQMRIPPGTVTYGRLATIFCNNAPAVDLLEIAAPVPGESSDLPS